MHPDPQKAFSNSVGGDAFHYLYFGRKSFDALLRSLENAAKPDVDRTTKKDVNPEKLMEWAKPLFDSVENNQQPVFTQKKFEAMARAEFPDLSIPQLRKKIWAKRPPVFPRRARKGS
ncbi:hypothetical protein [Mesorhizobium sp. WSM2561]|uniref:hypothetical protein n=1 Tax=Mesorhizobium sp. WSM2561 TaxID=1040985 RepID=UPI00047F39AC|nr:hypothetical protein [Mesorhizobium sp. WSM2561]